MSELVEWYRAQLDEDEKRAQRSAENWQQVKDAVYCSPACYSDDILFIARHDPARVLRDVAAKRAIVDDLAQSDSSAQRTGIPPYLYGGLHLALRLLASAYADRPGYREAWRP